MTEARGSWVRAVSSLGWLAEIAGEQLGRLLMEGAMQMDRLLRAEGRLPGHACRSREQVAGIVGAACRAGARPRKTAMDCWVRADGILGRAWVRWVQAGEAGWNMQVEGDETLKRARLHAEGLGRAWGVLQAGGCRGKPRHA